MTTRKKVQERQALSNFETTIILDNDKTIRGMLDGKYDALDLESILSNIALCLQIIQNNDFYKLKENGKSAFFDLLGYGYKICITKEDGFVTLDLESERFIEGYKKMFKVWFKKDTALYDVFTRKINEAKHLQRNRYCAQWEQRGIANTEVNNDLKKYLEKE